MCMYIVGLFFAVTGSLSNEQTTDAFRIHSGASDRLMQGLLGEGTFYAHIHDSQGLHELEKCQQCLAFEVKTFLCVWELYKGHSGPLLGINVLSTEMYYPVICA